MYTEVSFGQFLDSRLQQSGVQFKQYPNIAIEWCRGDWGYEILRDMSVRIFRYAVPGKETTIAGPLWDTAHETRAAFEPRFEEAFKIGILRLQ